MASNDQEPNWTKIPAWVWLIIVICVVVVQVLYGIFVFQRFGPDMAVRGQFGDIFGGVNALFTGLAFAGVIYTILLQRRELELQREELRLNRAELGRSAQAQMDQVARLEEAADLSAITTLVNIYGSSLQPFWTATQPAREEIGRYVYKLETGVLNPREFEEVERRIELYWQEIKPYELAWHDTLQKHEKLVKKLEAMVEQRDHEEGSKTQEV